MFFFASLGCLCCTLVGRLTDSLEEILITNRIDCDRIIIETSGSAFPTALVQEINRVAFREEQLLVTDTSLPTQTQTQSANLQRIPVFVDGVVCVVDALNFSEYQDTSFTAKAQAQYTNVILLNKHELADQTHIDGLRDLLEELCPEIPIVPTNRGNIDYRVVFGLDAQLSHKMITNNTTNSTETDDPSIDSHAANDDASLAQYLDLVHVEWASPVPTTALLNPEPTCVVRLAQFESFLSRLSTFHCIRCKGLVCLALTLDQVATIQQYLISVVEPYSSQRLLSENTIATHATESSQESLDLYIIPVVLNWVLGKWSFLILPQFIDFVRDQLNSQRIEQQNEQDVDFSIESTRIAARKFLSQSEYSSQLTSWCIPSTLATQYATSNLFAHSRLTIFGNKNTIQTFSFLKMCTRALPWLTIRKQCCDSHQSPHHDHKDESSSFDKLLGFITVLQNDHTHHH